MNSRSAALTRSSVLTSSKPTKRAQHPLQAGHRLMPLSAALVLSLGAAAAQAQTSGLSGGVAVHGSFTQTTSGTHTQVSTTNGTGTNHSVVNWQSFGVASGHSAHIAQPNSGSTSINRVVSNNPSAIFGQLSSNGQLVVVNPSGITVGTGAVVDTAGFTASMLNISEADARAGLLRFGGTGLTTGLLQVDGQIVARSGDVILIAPEVQTGAQSLIQTPQGSTILAAGQSAQITGRGLEGITLQVQAPSDQVINLGRIEGNAVGVFASTLKHSGLIQANQAALEGGRVVLRATGGDALVDGRIDVSSPTGRGGQVDVLGNRVGLLAGADINANGATGGGSVRIGGDYLGQNAAVPNAKRTHFDHHAKISANAMQAGDGGRVIIWADESTRAQGRIQAKGGAVSGNGGFVETSGKFGLDVTGIRVDTLAANGKTGTWLLDPLNIQVVATGGTASLGDVSAFGNLPTQNALIDADLINNASSNVVLQATNNIDIDASINIAKSGVSFTAQAGGDITVGATAGITTNNGDIVLTAGAAASGSPNNSVLTVNGALNSQGGNITLESLKPGPNSINIAANIAAAAGNVTMSSLNSQVISGPIAISGNNISMLTTGANSNISFLSGQTVQLNATGQIDIATQGAASNINLNKVSLQSGAESSINASGGTIVLDTTTITGNGKLTLNGNSASTVGVSIGNGTSITRNGEIVITGQSTAGNGVNISGNGTIIEANGGALRITGQGTNAGLTAGNAIGDTVAVRLKGSQIELTGTGTNFDAVLFGAVVESPGDITIRGTTGQGIDLQGRAIGATTGSLESTGTNGTVRLIADKMQTSGGFEINSRGANGVVAFETNTATRDIVINGGLANTLQLNNILNAVTAPTLRVGSNSHTGNITLGGVLTLDADQVQTLSVMTQGDFLAPTQSIVVNKLAASANKIDLNGANQIGTVALHATGPAVPNTNAILFANVRDFVIGSVDGLNGIDANNGNVNLNCASNCGISQTQAITNVNTLSAYAFKDIFLNNANNRFAEALSAISFAPDGSQLRLSSLGNSAINGGVTKFTNINNTAQNGEIVLISGGSSDIFVASAANNGRIQVESLNGDVTISGALDAGSGLLGSGLTDSAIGVQAAGSITSINQGIDFDAANGSVYLSAANGIGTVDTPLQINSKSVDALASNGPIHLQLEADGGTSLIRQAIAQGNITLNAILSNLEVNRVISNSGNVTLTALGQNITLRPNADGQPGVIRGFNVTFNTNNNVNIDAFNGQRAEVLSFGNSAGSISFSNGSGTNGLNLNGKGGSAALVYAANGGIDLGTRNVSLTSPNTGNPNANSNVDVFIAAPNGNITIADGQGVPVVNGSIDAFAGRCATNNCASLPFGINPLDSSYGYTGFLAQNYYSKVTNLNPTVSFGELGGTINPAAGLSLLVTRGNPNAFSVTPYTPPAGSQFTPGALPPGVTFSNGNFVISPAAAGGTQALTFDYFDPVTGLAGQAIPINYVKTGSVIPTNINLLPINIYQPVVLTPLLPTDPDRDPDIVVQGQTCPR
jgi:filamentous hemagglutinin family protein